MMEKIGMMKMIDIMGKNMGGGNKNEEWNNDNYKADDYMNKNEYGEPDEYKI